MTEKLDLSELERLCAAAKKCPSCGYPTADGGLCGECACEDDGDL